MRWPKNVPISFYALGNGSLFILDAPRVDCIRHQQKGIQAQPEVSLQSMERGLNPIDFEECKQSIKLKHMLKCILSSGKWPEPKP